MRHNFLPQTIYKLQPKASVQLIKNLIILLFISLKIFLVLSLLFGFHFATKLGTSADFHIPYLFLQTLYTNFLERKGIYKQMKRHHSLLQKEQKEALQQVNIFAQAYFATISDNVYCYICYRRRINLVKQKSSFVNSVGLSAFTESKGIKWTVVKVCSLENLLICLKNTSREGTISKKQS